MNNDELKKKIISALQSVEFVTEKGWCGQCISLRLDYSAIADALIAAGLTFDKITAILAERTNSKTLIHKSQYYDEMKHRAEVAERALKNACEDVKEIVSFLIELSERVDGLHVEGYLPEESEPKAYINRAEKELAEEGKDD